MRSGHYAEAAKHVGVEKEDILAVLKNTQTFDFLQAVVMGPDAVDWEGHAAAAKAKAQAKSER